MHKKDFVYKVQKNRYDINMNDAIFSKFIYEINNKLFYNDITSHSNMIYKQNMEQLYTDCQ